MSSKFYMERERTANLITRTINDIGEIRDLFVERSDTWANLRANQIDFINTLQEKAELMRRNLVEISNEKDIPKDSD